MQYIPFSFWMKTWTWKWQSSRSLSFNYISAPKGMTRKKKHKHQRPLGFRRSGGERANKSLSLSHLSVSRWMKTKLQRILKLIFPNIAHGILPVKGSNHAAIGFPLTKKIVTHEFHKLSFVMLFNCWEVDLVQFLLPKLFFLPFQISPLFGKQETTFSTALSPFSHLVSQKCDPLRLFPELIWDIMDKRGNTLLLGENSTVDLVPVQIRMMLLETSPVMPLSFINSLRTKLHWLFNCLLFYLCSHSPLDLLYPNHRYTPFISPPPHLVGFISAT